MADPAAGARSESRMEAVKTRAGLIVVVLDEDEAEMLVTVTGDALGELDTALAAGQGGEAEARVLDFVAALHRELKQALTHG